MSKKPFLSRRSMVLGLMGLFLVAGLAAPTVLRAQAASASAYSVDKTPIGILLDDPRAKAVLDGAVPGFSRDPQFDVARTMTLRSVQPFAPDRLTDAVLARIDAQLKAIK